MSEASKAARKANRAKAERLVGTKSGPVDASGWVPSADLATNAKTGARPVSPRLYRRGGKVEGMKTKARADRKARKTGGKVENVDGGMVNKDVREANEERAGTKHIGAFKKGGRTHKMDGGSFVPTNRLPSASGPSMLSRSAGMKRGGKSKHSDEKEDKRLIKKEVKASALKAHGGNCGCSKCMGGRAERKDGGKNWIADMHMKKGALHKELHVPKDKKIPEKKLMKAEHSDNQKLAKRAKVAETLKGLHKKDGGCVSDGELQGTRPTGGRLARKSGGRSGKGKMNVNVIIATHPSHGDAGVGSLPPGMPIKPPGQPSPMPPPMPPPTAAASPMPMPYPVPGAAAAAPPMGGGIPPGMMPPMRKAGGRVHAEAGAGSGLGRLEKIKDYGKNAEKYSDTAQHH